MLPLALGQHVVDSHVPISFELVFADTSLSLSTLSLLVIFLDATDAHGLAFLNALVLA